MKFKELIVESNQPVNERPMGFVKQGLNKLGAKVLPGSFGAKAQGRLDTGTVANSLYKDYAKFLGQTGQKATDTSLAGFLKQQGINIDVSSILGNVSEEVALNRSALNNAFLKVAQQMAGGSSGGSAPAGGGGADPADDGSNPPAGGPTPTNPPAGGGNPPANPPAGGPTPTPPAGGPTPTPPAGGGGLGSRLKQAWANVRSRFSGSSNNPPANTPTNPPAGGGNPPANPPAGGPTPPAGPGAAARQANQSQQATQQNLNNYVRNVAGELNAANPQQKMQLTKELINYMADRKGTPEHDEAVPTVKQMIKRSGANPQFINKAVQALQSGQTLTMERRVYQVITKLLEMTNQSWKTVGIRAVLSESTNKIVVLKVL